MSRKVEPLRGKDVPRAAREVELPVCPACGTVGKQPRQGDGGRAWCVGPRGETHKKTTMVPVLYRAK